MKSNELRIGNYIILYDNVERISVIDEINDSIWVGNKKDGADEQSIEFIKPIPLTEEWLLKCGYIVTDENSAGKIYHIVEVGKFLNDDLMLVFYKKGYGSNGIFRKGREIKYVHQLQNLYFVLTGEELEINLEK